MSPEEMDKREVLDASPQVNRSQALSVRVDSEAWGGEVTFGTELRMCSPGRCCG